MCQHGLPLIALAVWSSCWAAAQDPQWLRDSALQKALASTVAIQSSNEPLRLFLSRLGASQNVASFVDRRIDPSEGADLHQRNQTLKSVFVSAAALHGGGACLIGDVMYIGPPEYAAALPQALTALRSQIRSLPADARKIWQRNQALEFPRLSRPKQLISDLAQKNGIVMEGIDAIPHDLWPQVTLPPMSLAERFACLLVGFGRWPSISADGKTLRIVEFKIPDRLTQSYTTDQAKQLEQLIAESISTAEIQRKGLTLSVTASPADHHRISIWLAENEQTSEKRSPGAIKVVSLNATASIGSIAQQVASQLGVEFVYEPSLRTALEAQVKVDVTKVTYEELLTQVLANTGMSFRLDDRQLHIFK